MKQPHLLGAVVLFWELGVQFKIGFSLGGAFALAVLASCTTSAPQSAYRPQSVASSAELAEVQKNFADAVVEACGEWFTSDLDIEVTSANTDLDLRQLRAGERWPGGIVTGMPVYRAADGVVHIKENLIGASCEVAGYGPPAAITFEQIAERLTSAEKGFIEVERDFDTAPGVTMRLFERQTGDIVVAILLNGNEPGAGGSVSRFSTLRAVTRYRSATAE